MQTLMRTPTTLVRPTTAPAQSQASRCNIASRRTLVIRSALIGKVNDPEDSKKMIKDKENKSSWGTPGNSNPLERKKQAHGEPAVDEAGEALEGAKQSVIDTAKQAKEAVEKLGKKGDE